MIRTLCLKLNLLGSRINEQKTEILKIGNPDTLNHPHIHQLVKDKVKVVGHHYKKVVSGMSSVDIQNYHPRI
jgi:UDP-N-acetylglucosamine enolpyruvyl transferase